MMVVTGMHRSGTSLLAMTINALGQPFGDESAMYGADQWNERGYFEQRAVVDLNSRLITGFGRTDGGWKSLASQVVYLGPGRDSAITRRAAKFQAEMSMLGVKNRQIFVKDPRFCLTLDAWTALGEVEGVIVAVRHPTEVANSLLKRQRVPLRVGYRFWSRHITRLLASAPTDALYIDYAKLAGAEALDEVQRLANYVGVEESREQLATRIDGIFDAQLRHHENAVTELTGDVADLWEQLRTRTR